MSNVVVKVTSVEFRESEADAFPMARTHKWGTVADADVECIKAMAHNAVTDRIVAKTLVTVTWADGATLRWDMQLRRGVTVSSELLAKHENFSDEPTEFFLQAFGAEEWESRKAQWAAFVENREL